ncbi:uncharacterized protein LOC116864384 [Lontra canadensis]|uniref:uncharacterized protein LOC116864384 n=1 Tax=Lontra canadensis TaxID=76717 RepID=UPI0013F2F4DB|nr:uncharacterized protein LOC116864384 [Lontra canadensis]
MHANSTLDLKDRKFQAAFLLNSSPEPQAQRFARQAAIQRVPPFPTQHHFRPNLTTHKHLTSRRKRTGSAFCARSKPEAPVRLFPVQALPRQSRGIFFSRGSYLNARAVIPTWRLSCGLARSCGGFVDLTCSVGPLHPGADEACPGQVLPPWGRRKSRCRLKEAFQRTQQQHQNKVTSTEPHLLHGLRHIAMKFSVCCARF